MDLSMPRMNGVGAIQEIKKLHPSTKILVLTVHKTKEHILTALKAGAEGYILKDATHGELMLAIDNLFAGKSYLSPGISERVIEGYTREDRVSNHPPRGIPSHSASAKFSR